MEDAHARAPRGLRAACGTFAKSGAWEAVTDPRKSVKVCTSCSRGEVKLASTFFVARKKIGYFVSKFYGTLGASVGPIVAYKCCRWIAAHF